MSQKRESEENKRIAVLVPENFLVCLLLEMARSCGFNAWLDNELSGIVWIQSSEFEVQGLLVLLEPVGRLLELRKCEAVAEAVIAPGSKPSKELREAIAVAQGRFLGSVFAESDIGRF